MKKGKQKLYAIIIDQLSLEMRSKLEGTTGHEQVKEDQDGTTLLAMIKNIMCGVEESLQNKTAIIMTEKILHTFWQNLNVENDNYKSQFGAYVAVLGAYAGNITVSPALWTINSDICNHQ